MSFRPYSGGELPNWGCHGLSMVHWALDMDHSGPVEIWVDPAEKLPTVVYHTPEKAIAGMRPAPGSIIHYKYANGVVLSLSSQIPSWEAGPHSSAIRGKLRFSAKGTSVIRKASTRTRCRQTRPRLPERQPHGELLPLRGFA